MGVGKGLWKIQLYLLIYFCVLQLYEEYFMFKICQPLRDYLMRLAGLFF